MKLLVRCSNCNRTYDASEREPGSQFRCSCGQAVTVKEATGHDAAVIRCTSCGSARQDPNANTCAYCGSTFTLQARDLGAVCPGCLARVSAKAEYCHHCGESLAAEAVSSEHTDIACPVCGSDAKLVSRAVGDKSILECERCLGMWLGHETFTELREKARRGFALEGMAMVRPKPAVNPLHAGQSGPLYRCCPVCSQHMNRRNFGNNSGIVIDFCRNHGVWFDHQELEGILGWVRQGGLSTSSGALWSDKPVASASTSGKPAKVDFPGMNRYEDRPKSFFGLLLQTLGEVFDD